MVDVLRVRDMWEGGHSVTAIARELRVDKDKVRGVLRTLGFELRNRSEAQKQALKTGARKPPMGGKKHSDEARAKMRAAAARRKGKGDSGGEGEQGEGCSAA